MLSPVSVSEAIKSAVVDRDSAMSITMEMVAGEAFLAERRPKTFRRTPHSGRSGLCLARRGKYLRQKENIFVFSLTHSRWKPLYMRVNTYGRIRNRLMRDVMVIRLRLRSDRLQPGIFAPHMDEFEQRGRWVGALCGETTHLHQQKRNLKFYVNQNTYNKHTHNKTQKLFSTCTWGQTTAWKTASSSSELKL